LNEKEKYLSFEEFNRAIKEKLTLTQHWIVCEI
jgi:hypothetical protein